MRAGFEVLVVVLAVALGLAVATTATWRTVDVGPLEVRLQVALGWPGTTTLQLPPFGEASARTHVGPARLIASVEGVDVPEVERFIERVGESTASATIASQAEGARETVSDVIERESRSATQEVMGLALMVAGVAAAVAAVIALAFRRRVRTVVFAGVLAAVLVIGPATLAGATFTPDALTQPSVRGALTYIPQLQTLFSMRLSRIEHLREQVASVANDLAAYYADPRSIASGGGLPATYRVLHVSDLHLDPVGAELARSLVRSYEASLVIDTGDMAKGGSAEEALLAAALPVDSVPVVFVPGNHDDAPTLAALAALPNVTVMATETVVVDGLRIFGVPDPVGATPALTSSDAQLAATMDAAVRRLEAEQAAGMPAPDIIAVHDPVTERALIGWAPVILSGHTHSMRLYRNAAGVRENSGTLGGMPYDPQITSRKRLPHGASVLYYTQSLPRRLIAVDQISVGVDGTTQLNRTVVDESLLPLATGDSL